MPLLDLNANLGVQKSENGKNKLYSKSLGCSERLGFFFASGDSFGCVKVWEVDRKSALFTFNFQEDYFSAFDADNPPPVRCLA